jgi:hypothetical protein
MTPADTPNLWSARPAILRAAACKTEAVSHELSEIHRKRIPY